MSLAPAPGIEPLLALVIGSVSGAMVMHFAHRLGRAGRRRLERALVSVHDELIAQRSRMSLASQRVNAAHKICGVRSAKETRDLLRMAKAHCTHEVSACPEAEDLARQLRKRLQKGKSGRRS